MTDQLDSVRVSINCLYTTVEVDRDHYISAACTLDGRLSRGTGLTGKIMGKCQLSCELGHVRPNNDMGEHETTRAKVGFIWSFREYGSRLGRRSGVTDFAGPPEKWLETCNLAKTDHSGRH